MPLRDELIQIWESLPEGASLDTWLSKLTDKPGRNTAAAVALGSLLFYTAERGRNPKVKDVWDAAIYCSTCLSVGYGDIFAQTPLGKIIGTTLMTIGPALSNAALDGAADERHVENQRMQEQVLALLQQIADRLEQLPREGELERSEAGEGSNG